MIRVNKRKSIIENHLSRGKVLLFKTIGILIPVVILLLLELSLRIFQYGNNLRLFVEFPENKNFLVFNPDASRKYFTNKEFATVGNVEPFKKKKEEGTLRIFVLGESTTAGYPYFHNGSFHRWLQYRLIHTFPGKRIEIINVSLTAVNSYTLFGFAKEIVNYKPDGVLIYIGHNEYYGAMGVASTNKIGGNPYMINLILKLRELRLTQLITNLYEKIAGPHLTGSGGTRMKMMVADEQIPYGSKLFKRGIEQFQSNIDKALNLFKKYKIPVFISNLVCNEKDLKPFVSIAVDSIRYPGFEDKFRSGSEALRKNDFPLAAHLLREANDIYNSNALCNYYLGKVEYELGDFTKAKEYFVRAKDFDGLRFRAPEEINGIILQLCNKYTNVYLVDTKAAFENWSDDHIIGNELILEHVHPNLMGYAIMSDVFYEKMKAENFITVNEDEGLTFIQLLQEMPVTIVDSLAGIYRISNLKKSWPFNEVFQHDTITISTEEEKLAWDFATKKMSWQDAITNLYTYYINNQQLIGARKIMETLVLEYPENVSLYEKTAKLCSKLKENEKAIFYLKEEFQISPSFEIAKSLFLIYLRLDNPVEAMPYIDYALKNNNSNFDLLSIKTYAEEVIKLKEGNLSDSTNVTVLNKIAKAYLKMDNREGATICIQKVLKKDSKNGEALSMLAQIKNENQ